jgi:RNA polymerase II subunit A small phosphatase-like protein
MNPIISWTSNSPEKKLHTASHKVLPANQICQKRLLSLLNMDKQHSKQKSPSSSLKNNTHSNSSSNHNNKNNIIINKEDILTLSISPHPKPKHKQKHNILSLQDKIFSPCDFTSSKNESRNQRIIYELSKELLQNNNSFLSNKKNKHHLLTTSSLLNPPSLSKYLPNKSYSNKNKKTLILDLDETLVHSALKPFCSKSDFVLNIPFEKKTQTIYVLVRPYVDEFLTQMAKVYELVIFTASIPDYANPLLNKLDPLHKISYRLFREHCTQSNHFFIKDLSKVNRSLKDMIIIDNNPISFICNKDNGIPILTWHNNQSDCELKKMIPFLEYLSKVDDVRDVIKKVVNGGYLNYIKVNKMIESDNKGNKMKSKDNDNNTMNNTNNKIGNTCTTTTNNNINNTERKDSNITNNTKNKIKNSFDLQFSNDISNIKPHMKHTPTTSSSNTTTARSSITKQNKPPTASSPFTNRIYTSSSSNNNNNEPLSRNNNNINPTSSTSSLYKNKMNNFFIDINPLILNTSSCKHAYKSFHSKYNNNETDLSGFYSKAIDSKKLTISQTEENIIFPSNDYKPSSPDFPSTCPRREIKKNFFPIKPHSNNDSFTSLDETYDRLSSSIGGRFSSNKKYHLSNSMERTLYSFKSGNISNSNSNIINLNNKKRSKNNELLLYNTNNKDNRINNYFPPQTATIILHDDTLNMQTNNFLQFKLNFKAKSQLQLNANSKVNSKLNYIKKGINNSVIQKNIINENI